MSRFSGKCDLFDLISGLGGWYDRNGKPVKITDPGVGVLYSDEYKDFLEFKRRTGGTMYQHQKVKVSLWNQDEVAKRCPGLEIEKKERTSSDKRYREGKRKDTYYVYKYYGVEYSLNELNKKGVYITQEIHFDTLLDLIPYYPYVVSACASSEEKMTVFLSRNPYPIEKRDNSLKTGGMLFDSWAHYSKELQEHYREIVLNYYNPEKRERVEEVTFDPETCLGAVSKPIDPNFNVAWRWEDFQTHSYWTSPKIEDADKGIIRISKEDLTQFIGPKAHVYYVEKGEHKVILN